MLELLLIGGTAYAIAYGASASGSANWRAIVGFFFALITAWFGGSILLAYLLLGVDADQGLLPLLGRGFWWALIGAGIGVHRARYKIRHKMDAPPLSIPKWVVGAVFVLFAIGTIAAFALPAYQDYTKRKELADQKLWEEAYQAQAHLAAPASASLEIKSSSGSLDSQVGQLESTQADQEHYRRIYDAHPDADSLASEAVFERWAATPEKQRVMTAGTTEQVIRLFSEYKSQRSSAGATKTAPPTVQPVDKSACAYRAVMTDADYWVCGISPPSGK